MATTKKDESPWRVAKPTLAELRVEWNEWKLTSFKKK